MAQAPDIPLHPNCMKPLLPRRTTSKTSGPLTDILLTAAVLFLASWAAMLFLGAAHSHDARVPDLGYTTTIFVNLAASWIIASARFQHDIRETR